MAKLLVIEDEPIGLDILIHALTSAGYDELISATDGEIGLAQAKEYKPALIITDMSLPKLTGWELIQQVRQDPEIGDTPIIALTAHATTEDRVAAYEAGVSAYEPKPLDVEKLIRRVNELIGD